MEIKSCKHGHLKTPDNVYGNGACKKCAAIRVAKRTANNEKQDFVVGDRPFCKRGHPRTAETVNKKTGRCRVCSAAYTKEWKANNPERVNAAARKKYAEGPRVKQRNAIWRKENPELVKKSKRGYYLRSDKEAAKARKRAWCAKNPEKVRERARRSHAKDVGQRAAYVRQRQAAKLQRTPPWLTKGQLKDMEIFYMLARVLTKETGIPHEVDHIVPLQGKTVSGLHVAWNLQVLTRQGNRSKGVIHA